MFSAWQDWVQKFPNACWIFPHIVGLRIGDAIFSIKVVAKNSDEHPEAGKSDYKELWKRLGKASAIKAVTLQFLTTTTFRVSHFEQPLPLPRWVFGSSLSLWSAFSPYPVDDLRNYLTNSSRWAIARHEELSLANTKQLASQTNEPFWLLNLFLNFVVWSDYWQSLPFMPLQDGKQLMEWDKFDSNSAQRTKNRLWSRNLEQKAEGDWKCNFCHWNWCFHFGCLRFCCWA